MDRYDSFDVMDRMFEQMRRTMMDSMTEMADANPTFGHPMALPSGDETDLANMDGTMMPPFGLAGMDLTDPSRLGMGNGNVTLERTDEGFLAVADVPGFERDEITVSFHDGLLSIEAAHEESEEDETSARRSSRRVSDTVRVPAEVDEEAIGATYHNGVLEIDLPTAETPDDAHVIDIE